MVFFSQFRTGSEKKITHHWTMFQPNLKNWNYRYNTLSSNDLETASIYHQSISKLQNVLKQPVAEKKPKTVTTTEGFLLLSLLVTFFLVLSYFLEVLGLSKKIRKGRRLRQIPVSLI